EAIGDYLARNDYVTKAAARDAGDRYFTSLKSSRPQIFGIYWSKPQMEARQGVPLAETRAFLNRLWRYESGGQMHFDPDRECTYADRLRRREPGDASLGLSPHMDAGSVERWLDPAYSKVYRAVFAGDWRRYEPFDGAFRTRTEEIPSPAVCSAFRTFQGWTALSRQGPGDGTLQLLPIARAIVYLLLRPLAEDVPDDDLCGAKPGRALSLVDRWHALLKPAITPIPLVEPGDTVWWHSDIIHAVEDEHKGRGYSNVIYIGAAPHCAKNAAYLQRQKAAFLSGASAPDFSPEDFEVEFQGRATADDLSELGKRQMGLSAW
ncbi:MAG TPA: YbiU family protein, partial [Dongiaceae bacterium]